MTGRRVADGTAPAGRSVRSVVGGIAAMLVAALLVVGLVGLLGPAVFGSSLGPRNWLAVLLESNLGVGTLPADALRLLNPIDLVLLSAVGVAYLGFWPGPGRPHRVWMAIAVALPFAGIVVLLITDQWGRSSVMSAGLIVAILLAVDRTWWLAAIGIAANGLLLVADFATGESPSLPVAVLLGAGYALLVAWFVLIGLLQLRRTS
jgi:hypothetical protein